MGRKADRLWSERKEAITLLADNPHVTAVQIIGLLFNSDPRGVQQDVDEEREENVVRIEAQRAREDAMIAARKLADKLAQDKIVADAQAIVNARAKAAQTFDALNSADDSDDSAVA